MSEKLLEEKKEAPVKEEKKETPPVKKEEKKEIPVKRDDPPPTTGDAGQKFGEVHVDTIMVDKPTIERMIAGSVVKAYKAGGSLAAPDAAKLSAVYEGYVYNMTSAFTVTSDFVEYDAGHDPQKTYDAGTNIVVINTATSGDPVYKFDVLGGLDDSVVRGIKYEDDPDDTTFVPVNGIATLPMATTVTTEGVETEYPGIVKVSDSISANDKTADLGYAASPKAVYDALSAAKAYADAQDSTYTLSGDASGETFVITLHGAGHDTATTSATIPGATSSVYGIVKLADDIDADDNSVSGYTAATPLAVKTALGEAKNYTDSKISSSLSGLDFSLSVGAGETLSTLTQEDGQVAAVKQSIAITENQVTNLYAGLKNAISAQVATAQPTTLNGTISLLMGLISALNSAAAVTPAP